MSGEEVLIALSEITREYVKPVKVEEPSCSKHNDKTKEKKKKDGEKKERSLLLRLPSFTSTLRPNFGKLRHSLRKVSCLNRMDEDRESMMEVPRHKSIDIGVGLARRMSLFMFTKRSVCVHPYHPYVPKQTTRKIYFCHEETK